MSDLCVLMGANLHKDGASILQVLQATFVCALCGIDVFTPKNIVLLIVAAIVGSTIMGAIPGGGYVGQLVIASIFGLPNWTIPIMALIVTLGDPFATLVNVTGDTALGMIAARIVNGRGWLERSLEEYAQDRGNCLGGSIRKLLSETPSGCISCVREGFLLPAYIFL